MAANIQASSRKIPIYPSEATGPKLMILLFGSIKIFWNKANACQNIFLEVVELSQLNCFLVDGHLNICVLVLWFKDFYVAVIIQ